VARSPKLTARDSSATDSTVDVFPLVITCIQTAPFDCNWFVTLNPVRRLALGSQCNVVTAYRSQQFQLLAFRDRCGLPRHDVTALKTPSKDRKLKEAIGDGFDSKVRLGRREPRIKGEVREASLSFFSQRKQLLANLFGTTVIAKPL
jgi:hypothetical protein